MKIKGIHNSFRKSGHEHIISSSEGKNRNASFSFRKTQAPYGNRIGYSSISLWRLCDPHEWAVKSTEG